MSPMAPSRTTSRRNLDCVCKPQFSHSACGAGFRARASGEAGGFSGARIGTRRHPACGRFRDSRPGAASFALLALQHVDGLGEVGDADVPGQGGVLALERQKHLPGYAAVAEVAGGGGAQFGDVLGFGEVHFEEAADAGGERQQVERGLGGFRRGAGGDLALARWAASMAAW